MEQSQLTDEALALQGQNGDPDASALLCERYKGMVRALARPYFLPGADREDLLQEGMIGLYKAILHYAPGHDASFRSFAELCIARQLISAVTSAARNKHQPLNSYVSLYSNAPTESGENQTYLDVLPLTAEDPADALLHKEAEQETRRLLDERLSPFERQVVSLFLSGLSYQQIAQALSCSRKSVDNALQRVRRKMET